MGWGTGWAGAGVTRCTGTILRDTRDRHTGTPVTVIGVTTKVTLQHN